MFVSKMLGLDVLAPGRFPALMMHDWDHADTRMVDHVIGAFYLVRRRLWESLGGMDERFFVYLEDLDFSTRARAAGYSVYFLSHVRAFHQGGGASLSVKPARLCLSLHSRILYCYKHFGWWFATGLMLGTLTIEPLARLAQAVVHRDGRRMREILVGYRLLWGQVVLGSPPPLSGDDAA